MMADWAIRKTDSVAGKGPIHRCDARIRSHLHGPGPLYDLLRQPRCRQHLAILHPATRPGRLGSRRFPDDDGDEPGTVEQETRGTRNMLLSSGR